MLPPFPRRVNDTILQSFEEVFQQSLGLAAVVQLQPLKPDTNQPVAHFAVLELLDQ